MPLLKRREGAFSEPVSVLNTVRVLLGPPLLPISCPSRGFLLSLNTCKQADGVGAEVIIDGGELQT